MNIQVYQTVHQLHNLVMLELLTLTLKVPAKNSSENRLLQIIVLHY